MKDFDGSVDQGRDIPNKRKMYFKDNFAVTLERRDPYGFVYIVFPNGRAPEGLDGMYTSFDSARIAVQAYMNNNHYNSSEAEIPSEKAPPLQYKQKYRDKSYQEIKAGT